MTYVYIMANRRRTMYTGVTDDLEHRVWEHKFNDNPDSLTARYHLTRLVFYAEFASLEDANAYVKYLKSRPRARKMQLVEERNPRWADLAHSWFPVQASS